MDTPDLKPRSRDVTDGIERAAARGMLRAVGMGDADWDKPQIGIASSWNEITPCNLSLDRLARPARKACTPPAATRWSSARSPSPTASPWATRGCTTRSSPARSSPTRWSASMQAERLDGTVLLAGCDKSLPGMLMAAARLDLAAVFLYAGTIAARPELAMAPGRSTSSTSFEAVGACAAGQISRAGRRRDRACHLPGRGCLRRHVHRQHDGLRRRGAGHVAARLG